MPVNGFYTDVAEWENAEFIHAGERIRSQVGTVSFTRVIEGREPAHVSTSPSRRRTPSSSARGSGWCITALGEVQTLCLGN
jgi:hypothetical protein